MQTLKLKSNDWNPPKSQSQTMTCWTRWIKLFFVRGPAQKAQSLQILIDDAEKPKIQRRLITFIGIITFFECGLRHKKIRHAIIKTSSCRVNTASIGGEIWQLGISFGYIFPPFSYESSLRPDIQLVARGNPWPPPLIIRQPWSLCQLFLILKTCSLIARF